jgi:FixJ family two-component response regulator
VPRIVAGVRPFATTFNLRLPIKSGRKDHMCSGEALIAVIDDDDSFRTALVDSLASLGYGARGFVSAEDFVGANAEGACDCIITDIQMPGMSGLDLMQHIRARGSAVPVIMITARPEPGLEAKAKASGAICLLRKPFDSSALTGCLEQALKI